MSAGAAVFARPAWKDTCANIAGAVVFASTAGKEAFAKIAGAAVFASTAGKDTSAKIAGAAVFASTAGEETAAKIAKAAEVNEGFQAKQHARVRDQVTVIGTNCRCRLCTVMFSNGISNQSAHVARRQTCILKLNSVQEACSPVVKCVMRVISAGPHGMSAFVRTGHRNKVTHAHARHPRAQSNTGCRPPTSSLLFAFSVCSALQRFGWV
jgi:hypothetical protein